MNYLTILGITVAGLLLCISSSISLMQRDIARMNITLNKIAKHLDVSDTTIGVSDNVLSELKTLVSEGKKIEAIKKLRQTTGLGLKEANEYIDSLSK